MEKDFPLEKGESGLSTAKLLLLKGRTYAAKYIRDECLRQNSSQSMDASNRPVLPELLDIILNPDHSINHWDMIDWLKWLMAAGKTPAEFFDTVRRYDTATTCHSVWTANVVAYRCRTCGISPCMSLCDQCFKEGDHEGHDFNMFKSQAGGACDCGNEAVMKETGFCHRHGPHDEIGHLEVPPDLLAITEAILPRVFLRFLLHCRDHSAQSMAEVQAAMEEAGFLLDYLQDLSCLGEAMRATMTKVLCNPMLYKNLMNPEKDNGFYNRIKASDIPYREALESIPFAVPEGYEDIPTLVGPPVHKTILDEIVFWTVKFEFPQKLVCFLITMRPDAAYEDAFARAFVQHYSRISVILVRSSDIDTLSNRIVHISVQLFSDRSLAYKMTDSFHLLYVMLLSLKNMMQAICGPYVLNDERNTHRVVRCSHKVMKKHCYWPLLSDLNNIFTHKPIAEKFMSDPRLVNEWFSFITLLQGMNTNVRELTQHMDIELQTYYAAFAAESEASISSMWALVCHLKDFETKHYTLVLLKHCLKALADWFKAIHLEKLDLMSDPNCMSFHLPLHRNFAVFLCQAVKYQGAHLEDVLPSLDLLKLLVVHPLRVQIAFYEILCGMWVRNGLQIRGQVMTYTQFSNSMVDADIFLLQVGAGEFPPCGFLNSILERFLVLETLSLAKPNVSLNLNGRHEIEQMMMMLESCLTFLATLTTARTNIGVCEKELSKLEMVTLLCMKDKTHSELVEYLPIKRASAAQSEDFKKILDEVSYYRAPNFEASGTMRQGMFYPQNHVWEHLYDPIYVLLRAVDRRYYQDSLDRYKRFCKQSRKINSKCGAIWPPYRLPGEVHRAFKDPRRILDCRTFHAAVLVLLYKALHEPTFNENILSLAIYLIELVLDYKIKSKKNECGEILAAPSTPFEEMEDKPLDGCFDKWFHTDDIFYNATITIDRVYLGLSPSISSSSDASDVEMKEIEGISPLLALASASQSTVPPRPLLTGSEVVPYHERNTAIVPSQVTPLGSPETPTSSERLALPSSSTPPPNSSSTPEAAASASASSSGSEIVPVEHRVVRVRDSTGNEVARFLCQARVVIESRSSSRPHASRRTGSTIKAISSSPHVEEASEVVDLSQISSGPSMQSEDDSIPFGESIISLLLKLHSKLSGKPGSYRPNLDTSLPDSRIGDGPFFIAKLLNKFCQNDEGAKRCVMETKALLYPRMEEEGSASSEEEAAAKAQEERKRKARERQKKIMAEFSQKQKYFMKKWDDQSEGGAAASAGAANGGASGARNPSSMDVEEEKFKAYDCVICNQSIPSTPERPVGLVVLLQATSVLGHQTTSERLTMPTTDVERATLRKKRYTRGQYMEKRADILNRHFDLNSRLMSMNIGWEGGVHIQTCGHHLHLDCHQSYLHSLSQTNNSEYHCPLCRQLANSVLPISPEIGELSTIVKHSSTFEEQVESIDRLLKDMTVPKFSDTLTQAMARMMENMTVATYPKYRTVSSNPSTPSLFTFISSILRTNLEMELVQRKGSLITQRFESTPEVKRSCLMPLLHVLGFHCKIVQGGEEPIGHLLTSCPYWIRQLWASLTQRPAKGLETALNCREIGLPMLFKDSITVLLQMMLLLPSKIDKDYFACIICNTYRLVIVQAAVSSLLPLSESQREQATTNGPLASLLALVHSNFRESSFFCDDQPSSSSDEPLARDQWTANDVTCEVRDTCLHFLRIASLLKSHVLEEALPAIADPLAECGSLEQYLGVWDTYSVVNTAVMGKMFGSLDNWVKKDSNSPYMSKSESSSFPSSFGVGEISSPVSPRIGTLSGVCNIWCSEVALFASQAQVASYSLLTKVNFFQPRLLRLPTTYDAIFQYYHRKQCSECNSIPKDPVLCLLCGTLVCMHEQCCQQHGVFEAVQHSINCGAGTGIFLYISQSTVIVIRGPRFCFWGCIHLDSYGEEDRDLKRGKPLYLREDRYNLLEQQWISHGFDHIAGLKWKWHQDKI